MLKPGRKPEKRETEDSRNIPEGVLTPDSPQYPEGLRRIPNPPGKLYFRGNLELLSRPAAAVVGCRKPTAYGKWAAGRIGKALADHGILLVSGMAAGIDAAAHWGALRSGGGTAAVLGCGLDICYPRGNRDLYEKITEKGLLLSEYPEGFQPTRYSFPMRNRIISGLSAATAVVEAGRESGALITAECAAEQGRTVYAVPGNIDSLFSFGTNRLIRDGAVPLLVPEDLLEPFQVVRNARPGIRESLGADERKVYDFLRTGSSEKTGDELCRGLKMKVEKVNAVVAVLEIKGIVSTSMGKIFIAK